MSFEIGVRADDPYIEKLLQRQFPINSFRKVVFALKRIVSACLEQTNRFESEEEFAAFTSSMNRRQIAYKIVFKEAQPDGSVIAGVKRQYNHYSTGSYLD